MKNRNNFLIGSDIFLLLLSIPGIVLAKDFSPLFFTFILVGAMPLLNLLERFVTNKKFYQSIISILIVSCIVFGIFLVNTNNIIGVITMVLISVIAFVKSTQLLNSKKQLVV